MNKALLLFLPFFFTACSNLFFYPDHVQYRTPAYYHLAFDDITFSSKDGTQLHAWRIYPKEKSKGAILVAHGNAQNLSSHFTSWVWLVENGYELFIFDYRAYGKSEGEIDLEGSIKDTQAALDYMDTLHPKYVVCGQSLGGTLLLNVLHRRDNVHIDAVIIDSTFIGFQKIANDKFSQSLITWPFQWIPYLILPENFDAKNHLDINKPILFLHGTSDLIIPAENSWQLYQITPNPRMLWIVKDAKHISSLEKESVQKDFMLFLEDHSQFYAPEYSQMRIYE